VKGLEIYNMARQRGENGVSFGTSTGKYFSTSISGHAVFCRPQDCVPECQVNVPFWLRFLADVGWHWQINKRGNQIERPRKDAHTSGT
jgi:hypothetical protein